MEYMKLSPYPKFRLIDITDKPLVDEVFRVSPPKISEFTFTNLYAWRHIYKFSLSDLNGSIILRTDEFAAPRFFTPIGKGDVKTAIEKILGYTGGSFMRVPDETKTLFEGDDSSNFEPDPDNFDYIYRTEDLVKLPGKKYDGKRNLIKKFRSTHEHEYIVLDGSNAKSVLDFEDAWCSIKDCDNVTGLYNEREALREIISNFASFKLAGGAIKTEGMVRAVAISERLNDDTLVMHILKADPNIVGLYQVMMNEFLSREGGVFKFVNLEQDLGVEGLRKSKLSYHPVEMIKKYTLTKWKR